MSLNKLWGQETYMSSVKYMKMSKYKAGHCPLC